MSPIAAHADPLHQEPTSRTYVITYPAGRELCGAYVGRAEASLPAPAHRTGARPRPGRRAGRGLALRPYGKQTDPVSASDSQSTSGPGGSQTRAGQAERAPLGGRARGGRQGGAGGGAAGVPRRCAPSPTRPDPVALLERQAESRVPELVPIRYGRMLVSPFTFYRGAALIMADDLATTPNTGLRVQLCGDAHLSNFGVFASPSARSFDINDFDETLPAPCEWDVKRLAASLEVAGRDRGYTDADRDAIVTTCVPRVPARDAARGAARDTRGLVRPHGRRAGDELGPHRGARPTGSAQEGREAGGEGRGQGQDPRQHEGLREAGRRDRRQAARSSPIHR